MLPTTLHTNAILKLDAMVPGKVKIENSGGKE